jgi:hypothetical protein
MAAGCARGSRSQRRYRIDLVAGLAQRSDRFFIWFQRRGSEEPMAMLVALAIGALTARAKASS